MGGSFCGGVAQTVEQVNHNHSVGGSSPSAATIISIVFLFVLIPLKILFHKIFPQKFET